MGAAAAPAKINLTLHVTGRRPNGYHELDSLVAFAADAAAQDELVCSPASSLSIITEGQFAGALDSEPERNLVWRAARLLDAKAERGAVLRLTKRLPVASGIGGGSADAAAALRLLNGEWQLGLSNTTLAEIGLALGADIPACLISEALRLGGIGDMITPLAAPLPPVWAVLVNPGAALATPDVFDALRANGSFAFSAPLQARDLPPASAADLALRLKQGRNDLEAPARFLCPAIDPVLAALRAQGGCLLARLSGSGATCFGLFAEARHADIAARNIARAEPHWWSVFSRLR